MGWQPWLLGLWAAGVTFVLFRLGIGLIWVCWITRRAERMTDAAWLTLLEDVTTTLRFRGRVSLRRSDRTTIPVACGLWRPTLLMPLDADEWSADRRRVVLLHELAHVKRRDCRLQAIAQLAYAWHWFNPARPYGRCRAFVPSRSAPATIWFLQRVPTGRRMPIISSRSRGRFGPHPLPRWAMLAMAAPSQLEGRVLAILDTDQRRHAPPRLVRVTVATLVLQPLSRSARSGCRPLRPTRLRWPRVKQSTGIVGADDTQSADIDVDSTRVA